MGLQLLSLLSLLLRSVHMLILPYRHRFTRGLFPFRHLLDHLDFAMLRLRLEHARVISGYIDLQVKQALHGCLIDPSGLHLQLRVPSSLIKQFATG